MPSLAAKEVAILTTDHPNSTKAEMFTNFVEAIRIQYKLA